jgi:DNA-binding NarL/FixJ family response regulator
MHPDAGPAVPAGPADPAASDAPLRVVVIDADDRIRESLCGLLCIGHRIEVVGGAGAITPGIEVVIATQPDIVVLDPRLPEVGDGLACIRRLRAVAPDVRILVMGGTVPWEGLDLAGAADGFIRKTFRPADLVAAVIAAAVPPLPAD